MRGWLVVEAEQDPRKAHPLTYARMGYANLDQDGARGRFHRAGALMRAAIIGAGGIARVHARLIRELGGELVGVCGRTLASAAAFGGVPAYDNLAAMLHAAKPAVLHVCSPHYLHAEHSIAGFAAGAHVLCEKPMATSLDDCRRMIDAADRARRVGAIAYTYRGYPVVEVLRHRVAAGEFGELRRINGCYLSQDVLRPGKIRVDVYARKLRRLIRADGPRRALARSCRIRHRPASRGTDGAVLDARLPGARLARRRQAKGRDRRHGDTGRRVHVERWRNRPIC